MGGKAQPSTGRDHRIQTNQPFPSPVQMKGLGFHVKLFALDVVA
jgi:hypothetical protein